MTEAPLLEVLISGFFAIACARSMAGAPLPEASMRPRDLLRLKSRLERLSCTRWQWISIAALLIVVRLQAGVPLAAELTAAALFLIFLALPCGKTPGMVRGKAR